MVMEQRASEEWEDPRPNIAVGPDGHVRDRESDCKGTIAQGYLCSWSLFWGL